MFSLGWQLWSLASRCHFCSPFIETAAGRNDSTVKQECKHHFNTKPHSMFWKHNKRCRWQRSPSAVRESGYPNSLSLGIPVGRQDHLPLTATYYTHCLSCLIMQPLRNSWHYYLYQNSSTADSPTLSPLRKTELVTCSRARNVFGQKPSLEALEWKFLNPV